MKRARALPFIALTAIVAISALAPVLPLPDPVAMEMVKRFAPPSFPDLLGRDDYGRSVLSRLIWGTQISLLVAVASALLAGVIGTILGILAAYLRGITETLIMRFMDVLLCLPSLLVAMLFVTLYGTGATSLIPVMALIFVPNFTRVVYAAVLTIRSQEYVEATRAMGASQSHVMLKTILPNALGPVLIQFSLATAAAVVLESGLSFLGLGIVPPQPSLGMMIGAARSTMAHAPLLLLWPCIALAGLTLTLNAVCDAVRDMIDPRASSTATSNT